MPKQRKWTWEETLVAFRLYCQTSFGKLHQHNPDIIELAARINRNSSLSFHLIRRRSSITERIYS
ncbi:MAG: hypothetical protein EA376_05745 [Phycisphaeraceae bacterium]|nr:MAG: hypothetical protein EA376_05745 [Phycisphaeraceae bacterium]